VVLLYTSKEDKIEIYSIRKSANNWCKSFTNINGSLQISMGAPSLIKIPKDIIFPIDIAMLEFKEDAIPITVKRVEIV